MNILLALACGGAGGAFTGCLLVAAGMSATGQFKNAAALVFVAYAALIGATILSSLEKMTRDK